MQYLKGLVRLTLVWTRFLKLTIQHEGAQRTPVTTILFLESFSPLLPRLVDLPGSHRNHALYILLHPERNLGQCRVFHVPPCFLESVALFRVSLSYTGSTASTYDIRDTKEHVD